MNLKFGKWKYKRGHAIDEQCIFGGVERELGCMFFVTVHDRTQELLMEWIEPGMTIHSDCWRFMRLSEVKIFNI